MKRIILFLLCLLLAAGSILGLTACNSKPDPAKTSDDPDTFQFPYDDLSNVKESEVAYLLDPDFAITEENVFDCIYDYFAAPSILYYGAMGFPYDQTSFIKNEKATDFADAFRDITLEQISEEEVHNFNIDFDFCNAVGFLTLYEDQMTTYISFSRDNDFVQDRTFFRVIGVDLIPELIQIAKSLKDVAGKTDPYIENYTQKNQPRDIYDDLPDIQESDAAYLLDPDFTITEENFLACIDDYFTAPARLYIGEIQKELQDPEKAMAFAKVFHGLTLTQTSPDTYPSGDNYRGRYSFDSAIGHIVLYAGPDITHIAFSRDNGFVHDGVCFLVQKNLIPELQSVATSLEAYVKEPVYGPEESYFDYVEEDHSGYHAASDDLPNVQESAAAYLLDPEFAVTTENFANCMDDYFAAPSILFYYFSPLYGFEDQFIQDERAADFAEAFHDLTLTQIPEEEFSYDGRMYFDFHNAIGFLELYEQDGTAYISFSRQNDLVHDTTIFRVEGDSPVKELNRIAVSLKDIAKDPVYENEGE